YRSKLTLQCRVKQVWVVFPLNWLVSWDGDCFHVINLTEFFLLGLSSTSHPRKLVVHPEQVLVSNVSHGLVLFLNLNAFLSFNCLVKTIGEPPSLHYPSGK